MDIRWITIEGDLGNPMTLKVCDHKGTHLEVKNMELRYLPKTMSMAADLEVYESGGVMTWHFADVAIKPVGYVPKKHTGGAGHSAWPAIEIEGQMMFTPEMMDNLVCPECKGTGIYTCPIKGEQPCSLGCEKK